MYQPLKLPPGVVANGTPHETKGRWRDANFVRWVEGVMQPVGGWSRASPTPLTGRICGIQPLRDLSNRPWIIVGTNEGVYSLRSGVWTDLTPTGFVTGYEVTNVGSGYSAGLYNAETYSTPRSAATGLTLEADSWSFDTWGEFIIGVSVGDGVARVWKPGTPTVPADTSFAPIANAPIDNRGLVATNERHLMLIGVGGDPRRIQWSAREDYTVWTPSALNLAGDLLLETSGTLQKALKVADDILVLSEVDAFRVRYVGQPFGYGREKLGTSCGVAGPMASAVTNDFAVWMGPHGFWLYRGQLQQIPCDVWDFVFPELNVFQMAQIVCGHNPEFSEVWWFFPKGEATKNSHYVAWNYRENWWTVGELDRTAWSQPGVWPTSLGAGVNGHIYEHERKLDANVVQPRDNPRITSSPFELGAGDQIIHVLQLIPGQESAQLDALQYKFTTRFTPLGQASEFGPFTPDADGYTDVRFTGREITWEVVVNKDIDWRLGVLRADIRAGGRR